VFTAMAMAKFQPGECTRAVATESPCCGRVGSVKRLSISGKLAAVDLGGRSPTVRVTSLQRVSERVRTAEGAVAVAELAEELTLLVRLVSQGLEARTKCRDGAPEVHKWWVWTAGPCRRRGRTNWVRQRWQIRTDRSPPVAARGALRWANKSQFRAKVAPLGHATSPAPGSAPKAVTVSPVEGC
jgi:hypothetical protein